MEKWLVHASLSRLLSSLPGLVLLGACAQQSLLPEAEPEPVQWIEIALEPEPVQWINAPLPEPEPEVVLPEPEPVQWIERPQVTRNDKVILLPKTDGTVGMVVVRQDGTEFVLDKPYAAVHIEGPGQVTQFIHDEATATEEFAAVRGALPARPTSFLVYFLEGNDEFTSDSELEIDRIFADLKTRPVPEISVVGHTDAVGGVDYNDKLSLQRAERVQKELIRRGMQRESISIAGRGKRELLVLTSDGVSEPRNRRVEIIVK